MKKILKDLRLSKNMTQQQLAEELFISWHTYQVWERKDYISDSKKFHQLLNYYNVTSNEREQLVLAMYGQEHSAERV